jgi:hypothetical protein
VAGEREERHRRGSGQACSGSGEPQNPVEVDGAAQTHDVTTEQERPGSDREQGHRRRAEEVRHHGIEQVASRRSGIARPIDAGRRREGDEQCGGRHPDGEGADVQTTRLPRQ